MNLTRSLVVSLLAGVILVTAVFAIYQAREDARALQNTVEGQAAMLAESQQLPVERMLRDGAWQDLHEFVNRFQDPPGHGQLAGIAVYDAASHPLAITSTLAPLLTATPAAVGGAVSAGTGSGEFFRARSGEMYVFALPVRADSGPARAIAIFHRADWHSAPVWRHVLTTVLHTLLIVVITLLIMRWSLRKPLRHMTQWLRDLRTGNAVTDVRLPKGKIFKPLTSEVRWLASSLRIARAAAEEEARLRDASLSVWTAERLRVAVADRLNGSRLFAVSNREPYEHAHRGGDIVCSVPPSGLVTALEPILRACDGTWIAQATGDADRETVDEHGSLRVPPDHPQYKLRRLWLSPEEQAGFYFGFANEGLWPLCHIAHTRPIFRTEDWNYYQAVNRKFAAAVLEEMEGETEPFVLVQDYHFALLPLLLKQRRPDARIALFWHIPWPNPEAFGICPWQRQLLDGMLGADLIGFHIQAHCNNFLATVDRALESRVDDEHFAVNRHEHTTTVRPFPISVAFEEETGPGAAQDPARERARLLHETGLQATFLGIGVDRVDYTKGIPERFRAIERFLDLYPHYREKLVFVQIGAPSRTHIKRYQDLMSEVEEEAERINRRFRTGSWSPIVFLKRNHSHQEILPYYRTADFCMVTALHDGMNLVAKEYVAACSDERGALILSRFTGASHELVDALVVNPYDTEELAHAIHAALTMTADEKRIRMGRMRAVVKEHNVYRWAESLIRELAGVRLATATAKNGTLPSVPRPDLQPQGRLAG